MADDIRSSDDEASDRANCPADRKDDFGEAVIIDTEMFENDTLENGTEVRCRSQITFLVEVDFS